MALPLPEEAAVEIGGIRFLQLHRLIELKLASGMSSARRLRDLVDVQELFDTLGLPVELEAQLDPSVRDKYRELWAVVQDEEADPNH